MHQQAKPHPFILYTKKDYTDFLSRYKNKIGNIEEYLLSKKSTQLVNNIRADMVAFSNNDDVLLASVNYKEYDNAIICSPFATYIKYPLDHLESFNARWIKALVLVNAALMGLLCRATRINQLVQLNNNLNSLIKHPSYFSKQISTLTDFFVEKFSKHAIALFRVNDTLDPNLLKSLREKGYIIFPDRAAHVFFPQNEFIKRSHTKRDISLLNKTPYQILMHEEIAKEEGERLSELYQRLFIDKHSKYNPIYTAEYFQQALAHQWHHYRALRNPETGKIDAFISWFYRDGVMICGPLGYDTAVDQKIGLYRMLVALCLKHANEQQLIFNMGAGSDEFKSKRGSAKTMEHTAVYCKHLPYYRHLPWRLLSFACNKMLNRILDESSM